MLIRRLTLASGNPAAQASFWGERLGLPVERGRGGATSVRLVRTTIAFEPSAPAATGYHFAINVPRGRIGDARAWLEQRVELLPFGDGEVQIRFAAIGADAVYFRDADGNDVELIARDALPYDDDAPFGPSSLLEVSEIGIASADVAATRRAIIDALQAPVFWGDRTGDGLCAVGDAVGAVLVSPIGRGWIPIDLPAAPLPTTITALAPRPATITLPEGPYRIEAVPDDAVGMPAPSHAGNP